MIEEAEHSRPVELFVDPEQGSANRPAPALARRSTGTGSELLAKLGQASEGLIAVAEALGAAVGEMTATMRVQSEKNAGRKRGVELAQKMALTLGEAEDLGFRRRNLRVLLNHNKLTNLGTAARPRIARAQLENLWKSAPESER